MCRCVTSDDSDEEAAWQDGLMIPASWINKTEEALRTGTIFGVVGPAQTPKPTEAAPEPPADKGP
jgi:hypothetical protein